jgi:hypothetical protein
MLKRLVLIILLVGACCSPCSSAQQPPSGIAPETDVASQAPQRVAEPKLEESTDRWSLANKLALWAGISAALQFLALVATIAVMIRNGHRQLRAYVVVERGIVANVANPPPGLPGERIETVARIMNPQAGPHAQITIKNAGQTPAYDLVHWASIDIREYPLNSLLPPMPKPPSPFWTVLGPGIPEVKTLRMLQPLSPEQIEGLRRGTLAIYCYGEIRYRDAFRKSRRTRYRCMYSVQSGIIGVGTDLIYCEDGNEAN